MPEPKKGLDQAFDLANTRIEEVKALLDDYLDEV